ncbi:MAG: MFS transporter [Candidatus Poseidoniales archaeon]|nr:MAG: MFS transporter [Candidatus Poseidoniales archaeon]
MNGSPQERHRGVFAALVAAFFVDFLGYAFIVPILPSWQTQFDLNATQATMLVSLWAVPLFLLGPFTGRLVDRYGPAKTIGTSLVFLSLSSMLYLVATTSTIGHPFALLVLARLLHGMSGAAVMTAGLAGASVLWPTNFGEQAGKLVGMAAIGGLLGPVLGGVLFNESETVAFVVLAVMPLLALPVLLLNASSLGPQPTISPVNVDLSVFLSDPVLFRAGVLVALTTVATGALEAGVPLFLDDEMGLNPAQIGGVLLSMVLMQGLGSVLWGRLVDRHGPTRYMMSGWALAVLSLVFVALAGWWFTGQTAVLAMIVLLGLFQFSIAAAQIPMLPVIDTATHRALGAGHLGLAFGAFGAAWGAGTIVGPLLIGPMFDLSGSWPLAIGALAIPTSVALWVTVRYRQDIESCYLEEMNRRTGPPMTTVLTQRED